MPLQVKSVAPGNNILKVSNIHDCIPLSIASLKETNMLYRLALSEGVLQILGIYNSMLEKTKTGLEQMNSSRVMIIQLQWSGTLCSISDWSQSDFLVQPIANCAAVAGKARSSLSPTCVSGYGPPYESAPLSYWAVSVITGIVPLRAEETGTHQKCKLGGANICLNSP